MITSVAKVRETPYLKSSQVIGWPSCQTGPSLRVNDHWVASSLDWPVSVARSGIGVEPLAGSVSPGGKVTRLR